MKKGMEATCAVCGKKFTAKSAVSKYCSDACYQNGRGARDREKYLNTTVRAQTAKAKAKAKRDAEWARIGRMMNETGLSYGQLSARGKI